MRLDHLLSRSDSGQREGYVPSATGCSIRGRSPVCLQAGASTGDLAYVLGLLSLAGFPSFHSSVVKVRLTRAGNRAGLLFEWVEQSRGPWLSGHPEDAGARKVRTPQSEVAGNSRPPRGEDQWHRDYSRSAWMLGVKRAKLYLEQVQAEALTLLAEPRVGCNELVGNYRTREMIALDRMRLTDPLKQNLYSYPAPPSSRGLGRHPFKVEIAGSNPAGGTT